MVREKKKVEKKDADYDPEKSKNSKKIKKVTTVPAKKTTDPSKKTDAKLKIQLKKNLKDQIQ